MATQARTLADELDALLPQTQCTRCGYAGCRPYAEALATGEAAANRCPPGGESTLAALADRLGVALLPLDPQTGAFGPPRVAVIDEAVCIGCAKCLAPCPVDAIVGARRFLHTVIASECSGCELCIAPCPVDCIAMVPIANAPLGAAALGQRAAQYRARYDAHNARRLRTEQQRHDRLRAASATAGPAERDGTPP